MDELDNKMMGNVLNQLDVIKAMLDQIKHWMDTQDNLNTAYQEFMHGTIEALDELVKAVKHA